MAFHHMERGEVMRMLLASLETERTLLFVEYRSPPAWGGMCRGDLSGDCHRLTKRLHVFVDLTS
jgi:hypothetical protein